MNRFFNIKAKSVKLQKFSLEEIKLLYLQHTTETGQAFELDAITYVYDQTKGQPWLVNAMAYEACFSEISEGRPTITLQMMTNARNKIILRRDTHLDVLADRLKEPRVVRIIDSILEGHRAPIDIPNDDIQYVIDLGLVSYHNQSLEIANPIYQEIIKESQHTIRLWGC